MQITLQYNKSFDRQPIEGWSYDEDELFVSYGGSLFRILSFVRCRKQKCLGYLWDGDLWDVLNF